MTVDHTLRYRQTDGGEFVLRGKPFRFVGLNMRGLAHYGDRDALKASVNGNDERQLQLDVARDMGVTPHVAQYPDTDRRRIAKP